MSIQQVNQIKFNKLSESQYESSTPVEGEFYITPCPTYALDDEAVHKTGDETIAGIKTFSQGDIRGRTSTSSSSGVARYACFDKDGKQFSDAWITRSEGGNSNGVSWAGLRISNSEGMVTAGRSLAIWKLPDSDTIMTDAPTPPASDNSTQIATTNWCYDPAKSTNLVHRSGDETIAGNKTFTNVISHTQTGETIRFKNNNVEQMSVPSEYSEQMVYGVDQNGIRIGSLGIAIDARGNSRTYIEASKNINGTQIYNIFENLIDMSGNKTTYIQNKLLKAFVTETYKSGTSWYRVYSDGWIEQGFRISTNVDAQTNHTFLKPFKDTNYTLLFTTQTTTNNFNAAQPDWITNYSTTGFSYHCDSFAGQPWIYACGY